MALLPDTMMAIGYDAPGGPEVLRPETMPVPRPGAGEVLLRVAKGYRPIGRKIGFTNRRMWDEYGVHAPIWGYVYDRTVHDLAAPLSLAAFAEPKIEPEIMLGLANAPSPGMDDAALLSCVAWVAHGYEIVQSIYPGWKFAPPDAVIVDGHHGALLIGPRHEIGANAAEWLPALTKFKIELFCDAPRDEWEGRVDRVMTVRPLDLG